MPSAAKPTENMSKHLTKKERELREQANSTGKTSRLMELQTHVDTLAEVFKRGQHLAALGLLHAWIHNDLVRAV